MVKKILIIQHTPWEGPGRLLLAAGKRHRLHYDIFRSWQDPIPELGGYAGLVVLGGSPNVDQEKQYPFLVLEKQVLREAVDRDMAVLGFCLGHQLLAHVLGARIGNNPQPSVGFIPGFVTHEGRDHPVFHGLPRELFLFKWHGQAVQEPLPSQLALLATSGDCQVEAFSVKCRPHIVGVQFDNHAADPEDVGEWLARDSKWLASLSTAREIDPAGMLEHAREKGAALKKEFALFFKNWLHLL